MKQTDILDSYISVKGDLEITLFNGSGKLKSKHWYKNTIVDVGKDYIANRLIGGTGNTGPVAADFTQAVNSVPSGAAAATFSNIVVTAGAITAVTVANKGARYTSAPTVIIRGGNGTAGTDARALAIMEHDTTNPGYLRVGSIVIVSGGSGYTSGTQANNGTDYSTTTTPTGSVISIKLLGGFEKRGVAYMAIGETNETAITPALATAADVALINESHRNQLTFVQYPNTAAATPKRSILFTTRFGPYDATNARLTGPSTTRTIREAAIFNSFSGSPADVITDTPIGGDMLCRTTFGAIVKEPADTLDIRWTVTIQ